MTYKEFATWHFAVNFLQNMGCSVHSLSALTSGGNASSCIDAWYGNGANSWRSTTTLPICTGEAAVTFSYILADSFLVIRYSSTSWFSSRCFCNFLTFNDVGQKDIENTLLNHRSGFVHSVGTFGYKFYRSVYPTPSCGNSGWLMWTRSLKEDPNAVSLAWSRQ
jgi:hypothetical protein